MFPQTVTLVNTDCPEFCIDGTCYPISGTSPCKSGYYGTECDIGK